MMGTEWVVGQHIPSDYQVSIDSFIGIFSSFCKANNTLYISQMHSPLI